MSENELVVDVVESPNANLDDVVLKPWVVAGFKSRDAWRASKGQKTAKSKVAKTSSKPTLKKMVAKKGEWASKYMQKKAEKSAARKAKKAVKKVKASKKEAKKTPTERKEAHERTLKSKRALAKREEPNDREKKVLGLFKMYQTLTIKEMSENFRGTKDERYLIVKNAIRWPVARKLLKQVGRGTYKRTA